MAWTGTNPVSIGDATKKSHYDNLWDNAAYHRTSLGNFSITASDAEEKIKVTDSNSGAQDSAHINRSAGTGVALKVTQGGTGDILQLIDGTATALQIKDGTALNSQPDFLLKRTAGSTNFTILTCHSHVGTNVTHTNLNNLDNTAFFGIYRGAQSGDGVALIGSAIAGDKTGLALNGVVDTDDSLKTTAAKGRVRITVSGTTPGVNANLLVVDDGNNTRFIVDAEGDIHYDGTANTYDEHRDAVAARDLGRVLSRREGFLRFLEYNARALHDMGVVTFTPKEELGADRDCIFVSTKGMSGLVLSAIGEIHGVLDLALRRLGADYETLRRELRSAEAARRNAAEG